MSRDHEKGRERLEKALNIDRKHLNKADRQSVRERLDQNPPPPPANPPAEPDR